MKYSLRSLMIGITLFCVFLAWIGRVQYLKQCARFHSAKADEFSQSLLAKQYVDDGRPLSESSDQDARMRAHHLRLCHEYSRAAERPWVIVDESLPDHAP